VTAPLHVLFVHNDYGLPSGEEEAVGRLAALVESQGHRVSWLRKASVAYTAPLAAKARAALSGVYNPAARAEMGALLAGERVDVVQVQNLYPFLSPSVLLACRDAGVPVVMRCPNYRLFCPTGLHIHDGMVCERCLGPGREWNCVRHDCMNSLLTSASYALRNTAARLTRMITDNVSRFIVLSEFQKGRFVSGGIPSERIDVLPNVAEAVRHPAQASGVADAVVFVGRLSPEKGLAEFVECARRLPGVPFAVAGGTAEDLGLATPAPPNLRFEGFLRGRDLDEFYARARIFVCPSKWFEGFPNVVARAMAHGKPVVASRIGAIPEIVEDGVTGLLVEPGDGAALAAAIGRLWPDPVRCADLGRAGHERALHEFAAERVYERLAAIYRRAMAGGRD
jgi:glycosyltransferase involved in cell wall biosynthesis